MNLFHINKVKFHINRDFRVNNVEEDFISTDSDVPLPSKSPMSPHLTFFELLWENHDAFQLSNLLFLSPVLMIVILIMIMTMTMIMITESY